jgi:hypothetical protein
MYAFCVLRLKDFEEKIQNTKRTFLKKRIKVRTQVTVEEHA